MNDKELYQQILGIYPPWRIEGVTINSQNNSIKVLVKYDSDIPVQCPVCSKNCTRHDHAPERQWRHLDTCQYSTIINASIPRANCPAHGVKTVKIPWAEKGSHFTAMFESFMLLLIKESSIKSISKNYKLSWDEIDGIMQRGVARGLERRKLEPIKNIGIDEKAFQKHHKYSTIIINKDNNTVLDVLEDRKKETLLKYLQTKSSLFSSLDSISMDMWQPYISAFIEFDPKLKDKINFDHFHVSSYFSKAVDKVRSSENKELQVKKDYRLKHTRFDWLWNSLNIDNRGRREFMALTRRALKTSRAWAMKETAASLWDYNYKKVAEKAWMRLTRWMLKSRLKPMIALAKTIRNHLWGIINASISGVTNAISESKNAVIQKIKSRACGYRNQYRFRNAILFHLGGLDMAPSNYIG